MRIGLGLTVVGLALAAAGGALALTALDSSHSTRVAGHGLAIELPPGWEGEVYRAAPPGPTVLKAATFELPGGDDDFGGEALRRMTPRDVRIMLVEYEPPGTYEGASRWAGSFPLLHGRLAIGSEQFTSFEGIPDSHAFARRTFSAGGRYFDVWVDFASPAGRDALLGEANAILATLDVDDAVVLRRAEALWLQRVVVHAGFWDEADMDPARQWNLALSAGGHYVWFTNASRDPEGVVRDEGVRVSWGAGGLTIWVESQGRGGPGDAVVRRLVEASLAVPS